MHIIYRSFRKKRERKSPQMLTFLINFDMEGEDVFGHFPNRMTKSYSGSKEKIYYSLRMSLESVSSFIAPTALFS